MNESSNGNGMKPVRMYTTEYCPYCIRAKMLLKQRGVEATYQLDRVGLRTQQVSNLVIGDPRRPDLTARFAQIQTRIKWDGSVEVYRVVAPGVRHRGQRDALATTPDPGTHRTERARRAKRDGRRLRAVQVARSTGRITWYRYNGGWKRES